MQPAATSLAQLNPSVVPAGPFPPVVPVVPIAGWIRPPNAPPLPRTVELKVIEPTEGKEGREFCFTVDAETTIQQFREQFRGAWGQPPYTDFYFTTSEKDRRSLYDLVTIDQLSQAGPRATLYVVKGKCKQRSKYNCSIF